MAECKKKIGNATSSTPFQKRIQAEYGAEWKGGKDDDITILISFFQSLYWMVFNTWYI